MSNIIACTFTVAASFVLPLVLAVAAIIKKHAKPMLIGTATFLLFQVLTRIPIIQVVLPNFDWYTLLPIVNPFVYAIFLGLSAALFEEIGRFVMMKLFLRNRRQFGDAVSFGIGHGGIEAILIVGINALYTLVALGGDVGVAPSMMAMAGFERLFTIAAHIAWSVMIMEGINRKNNWYLVIAIALHAILDTLAVFLQSLGVNALSIEIILAVYAVLSLIYIFYVKNKNRKESIK